MHGAEVGSERTTVRERLKNEFHLGFYFLVACHPIRSSMSCPSIGTCSTTVFDHHNTNNKCNNNSRIISHNCNHHFLIINARYFVTAIVKPVFSSELCLCFLVSVRRTSDLTRRKHKHKFHIESHSSQAHRCSKPAFIRSTHKRMIQSFTSGHT